MLTAQFNKMRAVFKVVVEAGFLNLGKVLEGLLKISNFCWEGGFWGIYKPAVNFF